MLKPSYLEQTPDRLIELYSEVETAIIASMAERLSKTDFIPSAEWQYKKLTEMGFVHDEILRRLSEITGLRKTELERIMKDAGAKAIESDSKVYRKAGLDPSVLGASLSMQTALQAGFDNTNGLFDNLTRTTANTATKQFENALDRAWLEINSGGIDYNTSIRNAIKSLTDKGLATITYPTGHTDYLDVAVRRATVTGVNQTALKVQDTLADEMETDLVDVTAHAGARNTGSGPANHAEWQGKRYSRSGKSTKYPSLVEITGYGTGEGLGGWNCRHNMFPALEGMEPVYTKEELDEMNAPKYEYNGQKMNEYDAAQKQRYIERNIRKYKRESVAMKSAGQSTDSSVANLKKWQDIQKDFINQTGLKRQYDRENIIN